MLFKILSYFTKDTHKYKMNRLNQLLSLGFLSSIVVIVSCTIDFTLRDAGMDSGADSGSDSDSDTDAGTCAGPSESVYGNNCYYTVSTPANFSVAESACVAWGGHLASVSSAQENNYILAIISSDIWIGLHFDVEVADFVFTDGSPLAYTNWYWKEPWGGEDCAQMTLDTGEWYNKPCTDEYGFICKHPL
jgi:hypothetical protein